jgi:hypothetical protein
MSDRRAAASPAASSRRRAVQPHGAYVTAVIRDTARLVLGRYITAYDGLDIIPEAAQAAVPGP